MRRCVGCSRRGACHDAQSGRARDRRSRWGQRCGGASTIARLGQLWHHQRHEAGDHGGHGDSHAHTMCTSSTGSSCAAARLRAAGWAAASPGAVATAGRRIGFSCHDDAACGGHARPRGSAKSHHGPLVLVASALCLRTPTWGGTAPVQALSPAQLSDRQPHKQPVLHGLAAVMRPGTAQVRRRRVKHAHLVRMRQHTAGPCRLRAVKSAADRPHSSAECGTRVVEVGQRAQRFTGRPRWRTRVRDCKYHTTACVCRYCNRWAVDARIVGLAGLPCPPEDRCLPA